eukprot:SM000001S04519  [mRNA]  locus=s1:607490:609273:- [translate_table: standard]
MPEATLGTAGDDGAAAMAKAAAASPPAFKYRLTLAYDGTDFAGAPPPVPHWLTTPPVVEHVAVGGERQSDKARQTSPNLVSRFGLGRRRDAFSVAVVLAGWQLQRRPVTVQHHVEAVLVTLTGQSRDDLRVAAAGRTDAGVHARARLQPVPLYIHTQSANEPWLKAYAAPSQVVSFVTSKQLTCPGALKSLNALLPKAIRALEVAPAAPDFHARLHALAKTYHYSILCAPVMDPCRRLYSMHVTEALDLESMRLAARIFVGEHDFSTFANQSTNKRRRPVRHVTQLDIVDEGGGSLRVEISGSGFLYKQVRNMVGLLVDVGRGRACTRTVMELLQSRDRVQLALQTPSAPAHGLCLVSVKYPSKVLQPPSELSEMHHDTGFDCGEEVLAICSSSTAAELASADQCGPL